MIHNSDKQRYDCGHDVKKKKLSDEGRIALNQS